MTYLGHTFYYPFLNLLEAFILIEISFKNWKLIDLEGASEIT